MRWAGKSAGRRHIGRPRLRFERLEDRSLLAVAAFSINLYHDDGGTPGLPLANDEVEVGQTFFAQIVAREHHPGFSGLASVFIDIAWDADVLDIVAPFDPKLAVTPNLPLFVDGRLQQEGPAGSAFLVEDGIRQNVGHIAGLGGVASVSSQLGKPIGSDGNDRYVKPAFQGLSTTDDHFAWLHFRAEQAGEALLTMHQGGLRIVTLPASTLSGKQVHFEQQVVTVVEPVASSQLENPGDLPADRSVVDDRETRNDSEALVEVPAAPVVNAPIQAAPALPVQSEPVFEPIWRNASNPVDVDGTGRVAPLDVLIIANHLNISFGNWALPSRQFAPPRYLDVNGDGRATPHDALLVVNYIDSGKMPDAEGETESLQANELSETTPVLRRPDQVDAAVRDTVFTLGSLQPAPRERVTHHATQSVSARPDHVDASLRDAGRITGFGRNAESEPQIALASSRSATDIVLLARHVRPASWAEIEDILPTLAADWFRQA